MEYSLHHLLEALAVLNKYSHSHNPASCECDIIAVFGINPNEVAPDDLEKLKALGFFPSNELDDAFVSF